MFMEDPLPGVTAKVGQWSLSGTAGKICSEDAEGSSVIYLSAPLVKEYKAYVKKDKPVGMREKADYRWAQRRER